MVAQKKQRVLVVGCGCLGKWMAAHFSKGTQVFCYESNKGIVRSVTRKGLFLIENQQKQRARVSITDRLERYSGCFFDLIIFSTKCFDVLKAIKQVSKHVKADGVLFLQNGSFPLDQAKKAFKGSSIFRGVTTSAITSRGDAGAEVFFHGKLYWGSYGKPLKSGFDLSRALKSAGIDAREASDYRGALWAKLIFSAVMNPLPLLTVADYSILQKDDKVYSFVTQAIDEGKKVARARGITLAFDPMTIVRKLRRGKLGQFHHKGSMYYDFIEGRRTELNDITGELVQCARRAGIMAPALETIYTLTAAKEAGRL
ncbi:MAG: ketopantoate reductase family protein [Candidatus Omnitrophica bacterium]|nr:ketopantoate reductase family protein [Candidatus Omnitrophota bacterium]